MENKKNGIINSTTQYAKLLRPVGRVSAHFPNHCQILRYFWYMDMLRMTLFFARLRSHLMLMKKPNLFELSNELLKNECK